MQSFFFLAVFLCCLGADFFFSFSIEFWVSLLKRSVAKLPLVGLIRWALINYCLVDDLQTYYNTSIQLNGNKFLVLFIWVLFGLGGSISSWYEHCICIDITWDIDVNESLMLQLQADSKTLNFVDFFFLIWVLGKILSKKEKKVRERLFGLKEKKVCERSSFPRKSTTCL